MIAPYPPVFSGSSRGPGFAGDRVAPARNVAVRGGYAYCFRNRI